MRKKFYLIFFICLQTISFSQTQEKENLKVFTDKKTGDVYWNRKLPVYINLSTKPNGKGQTVSLGKEDCPKDEPFYLDTEGANFIRTRWKTDANGVQIFPKQEILFPVIADGLDPKSKISYDYKVKFVNKGVTYYDGSLTFSVSSKDAVSGVERMMYSVNKENYKECKESDKLKPKSGKNNIKVYAIDRVGNVEDADKKGTNVNFVVDEKAPVSTHKVVGPQIGNIYSPKCKVLLDANDDLSGVKRIDFKSVNKGFAYYKKAGIPLTTLKVGDNSITYFVTDNVNNKEKENSFDFFIDDKAPEVHFKIDRDEYINKKNVRYVSERSSVAINATDNKAGVDKVFAKINQGSFEQYVAPIVLNSLPNANNKISYKAIDKVTNKSHEKYFTFLIDREAPRLKWSSKDKYVLRRDTIYVKSSTRIKLSAFDVSDIKSGVKEIRYSIDGGPEKVYTGEFTFSKQQANKLVVKAIDNVNNVEIREYNFYVDDVAPNIVNTFSVEALTATHTHPKVEETQTTADEKVETIEEGTYPQSTFVYLAAKDEIVGNDKIYYSINDGKFKPYTHPITGLTKEQRYTIVIKAVDLLGNEAKRKVNFSISK
jgi:hypothetical protein